MNLTLKYTLSVLLIFSLIFLLSFYLMDTKRQEKMMDMVSENLMNHVIHMSEIAVSDLENVPFAMLVKTTDEKLFESIKPDWLSEDSKIVKITGYGSSVELYLNLYEDSGRYYLSITGFLWENSLDAVVDFERLMDSIVGTSNRLGYFYVVDQDGNTIYHTLKDRVGLNMKDVGLEGALSTFLTKGQGVVDYVYNGDRVRAFFKEMKTHFKHDVRLFLVNAITENGIKSLYSDLTRFEYFFVFPLMLGLVFLGSLIVATITLKNLKRHNAAVRNFVDNVIQNVAGISTSSAEIEKIAENTSDIAKSLSDITQNFATSAEEGRYEVNSTVKSINSFLDLLGKVNSEISRSVDLIESLNDLNDRITYLSDIISVLAINASIESAKEKIDREGIAKIVEHITRISKEARETSKITKKTIDSIQKSLSQLALYSERVEKEGTVIRSAVENISKVISDFVDGINRIKTASESLMSSSEETTAGVEEIVSTISSLRQDIDRLKSMISKYNI